MASLDGLHTSGVATALEVPCISVAPAAPHTHTVVFLHGRGDNVHSFTAALAAARDSQSRTLADALPSFRWVFPQAPMRVVASSIATNGPQPTTWPQWFDVWDTRDFASREELQAEGLREAVPAIQRILASEATLLGGRWDRLVLAGISMGGATSVHTLFNLEVPLPTGGRLGAFIGFSCRCPFSGRTLAQMREVLGLGLAPTALAADSSSDILRNTPMLLEHCVDDPVVPVANGRALCETLRGFGAKVEWKEYPSGGHWFNSPSGMDDVISFLSKHLAESGRVR
ncbi:hypothetical protein Sste5346_005768 [Sporothrix stenoceras]|uniref:Phospholipase/carboxylesterase/thioesterase domain-containing protein n=1 Tax=Sporothrix stenoceras TaxID=5173 RepID=A0ABR3Z1Q4_9PEZI